MKILGFSLDDLGLKIAVLKWAAELIARIFAYYQSGIRSFIFEYS